MTIRVVARIAVQANKINEAQTLLAALAGPTRKEAGCVRYDLLQNNADPTDFTFDEEWESDAALDAHLRTPHISAALARMPEFVASPPDIRRYTQVA